MSEEPPEKQVRIHAFGLSDVGQKRSENQDDLLIASLSPDAAEGGYCLRPDEDGEDEPGHFPLGPKGALLLVADGMGGAAAGALASSMAVAEVYRAVLTGWRREEEGTPERFALGLAQALEAANAQIHGRAESDPSLRGMGSTATLAGVLGDCLYCAQVGDSRAYLVRGGEAVQLTRDQSYVQELVDAGQMTEDEAERSEYANKILQALGPVPTLRPVLTSQSLRQGDVAILCSDGLSRVVAKEEMAAAATRMAADPVALCRALVGLANERGAPDNVTVIAARFSGGGLMLPALDDVVRPTVHELRTVA